MEKKKALIWKSHVLISFSISDKVHAFFGPLPNHITNVDKVREVFTCYYYTKPHDYLNQTYDLSFSLGSIHQPKGLHSVAQQYEWKKAHIWKE